MFSQKINYNFFTLFSLWTFLLFENYVIGNDKNNNFQRDELKHLSELPLSALLKVKKSIREIILNEQCPVKNDCLSVEDGHEGDGVEKRNFEITLNDGFHSVTPLPLFDDKNRKNYPSAGGGGWQDNKSSKIQTFFQLSVTALAFFAFGGYLLCMIVQAIKSKGTTYYHPAMMPMMSASGSSSQIIKKKRPFYGRRKRRNVNVIINETITEDNLAGPSPDDMYNALVLAAEQFVKLNQIQ